ncbi:MAG TPA: PAS domain S-box protein [Acetobacteraceae bacterium]|nr:PAS domain S-box protein [Acetobacteraceae bacterium]
MLDRVMVDSEDIWALRGGKMGSLIRNRDWSSTSLGPILAWPQSWRTAVDIMLCMPMAACIRWGRDGVLLYNDAYAAFAGRRHPGLLGTTLEEAWPEASDFTRHTVERVLRGEALTMREHHIVLNRHGEPEDIWVHLSYSPLLNEAGCPAGVMGLVTEVTERVRAEQKRRENEASLRSLNERLELALNAGPILGSWVWNVRQDRFSVDERFARSFGAGYEHSCQDQPLDVVMQAIHPDDRAHVTAAGMHTLKTGERFRCEYRVRHADGSYRWVEASGRCDCETDGQPGRFSCVLIDITDRKQMDLALRESEAWFRSMADSAPALIWTTDASSKVTFANRRYEGIFGVNPRSMEGEEWLRIVHEDDAGAYHARFRAAFEVRMPFTGEVRVRNKEGQIRWMRSEAVPRFAGDGKFIGYIGCAVDVTEVYLATELLEAKVAERTREYALVAEQLQTEMNGRERAEQALRQAQKMEAVGQLTGGIAHDFNNLLTGIMGNLELMQMRAARAGISDFDAYLEGARSAAARAAALTHRLLAFSRRQVLEPKMLAVDAMMADVEELIRRTVGPAVDVRVAHAPDLWPTLCDQNQLENALLNLAINARDAMPEGGVLTIETGNIVLDECFVAGLGDVKPGEYVAISVTDTGTGMSEDVVMRAFDPFFTTKAAGQGTGLGLSMIYGFVKQSGGHIRIESEPGAGTSVRLYLPRCPADAEAVESSPAFEGEAPRARAAESVLIVDDEASIRLSASEMLSNLGYSVRVAGDAASALAMLEQGVPADMLIADIGLPGMNGPQLVEAARRLRPELKVLFITGYAEGGLGPSVPPSAWTEVVAKPFSMTVLAGRIREKLDASPMAAPPAPGAAAAE